MSMPSTAFDTKDVISWVRACMLCGYKGRQDTGKTHSAVKGDSHMAGSLPVRVLRDRSHLHLGLLLPENPDQGSAPDLPSLPLPHLPRVPHRPSSVTLVKDGQAARHKGKGTAIARQNVAGRHGVGDGHVSLRYALADITDTGTAFFHEWDPGSRQESAGYCPPLRRGCSEPPGSLVVQGHQPE